jgi:hypothetical protein
VIHNGGLMNQGMNMMNAKNDLLLLLWNMYYLNWWWTWRERLRDMKDNETYELMIELFWMMFFVGVSYFEGIQLFINIDRILLFSFHLIDETGWF